MATTTTNAGFPKPSGTDPFQPDVDIANLADSVDSFIYSKFPDAITKTYSIPLLFATRALMLAETGRFTGQRAVVNADSNSVYNGDYKWSGTAWVRDSRWIATTKAALPTGTTIAPQIVAGTEGAKATVTSDSTAANNGDYVWSAGAWVACATLLDVSDLLTARQDGAYPIEFVTATLNTRTRVLTMSARVRRAISKSSNSPEPLMMVGPSIRPTEGQGASGWGGRDSAGWTIFVATSSDNTTIQGTPFGSVVNVGEHVTWSLSWLTA
jgi:hypothetical protein